MEIFSAFELGHRIDFLSAKKEKKQRGKFKVPPASLKKLHTMSEVSSQRDFLTASSSAVRECIEVNSFVSL